MKGKRVVSYDFYIVRAASYLTNYDRKVILRLYQPICGFGAVSLFFTLWSEVDNKALITSKREHESLLETTGCTIDEFEKFRNSLEAIGLMKTYLAKGDDGSDIYYYELYSPLSADKFLSHELYGTLLRQKISLPHLEECISYFRMRNEIEDSHVDISHSFNDVFLLNLNDTEALKQTLNSYDAIDAKNNSLGIQASFSMSTFYAFLKAKQISKSVVSKELVEEIKLMSTIYNLDEEQIATVLSKCIDMNGMKQVVNIDKFKNKCAKTKVLYDDSFSAVVKHNDDKFSQKEELINSVDPVEYLRYRQGGKEPTSTDIKLIERIKKETHIELPVINILLDYVLIVCKNTLPVEFTLTLATELRNNEVHNSADAQKYLLGKRKVVNTAKESRKKNNIVPSFTSSINSVNTDAVRESNPSIEDELAEWKRMQEEMKKGGKF